MTRRLMTFLVAAAIPAAGIPAASATGPAAESAALRGFHGGGAAPTPTSPLALVTVRAGRRTLGAEVTAPARCTGRLRGADYESVKVGRIPIKGGRASAVRTVRQTIPAGVQGVGGSRRTAKLTFSVRPDRRVAPSGRVLGRAKLGTVYRKAGGGRVLARCSSRRLDFLAYRTSPGAGRGGPRFFGTSAYLGATAQGGGFDLLTTRKSLNRVAMSFSIGCPSVHGKLGLTARRVKRKGATFSARGSFKREGSLADGTAVNETYRWRLSGRFGSRGVAGTWRVDGVARRASDSGVVDRCSTGRNRFRAAH